MGSSSSSQPSFTIELNKLRWTAGDTVSGRIVSAYPKGSKAQVPKIKSLRIQFRGEERVSMEINRVVPVENITQRASVNAVNDRSMNREPLPSHSHESALCEPLLEQGYTRITIEADQATSGPPPRRHRSEHNDGRSSREPLTERRQERGQNSVESATASARRGHQERVDSSDDRRHVETSLHRGHTDTSHRRGHDRGHVDASHSRGHVETSRRQTVGDRRSTNTSHGRGQTSRRQTVEDRPSAIQSHGDSTTQRGSPTPTRSSCARRQPLAEQRAAPRNHTESTRPRQNQPSRSLSGGSSSHRREMRAQTNAQRQDQRERRAAERQELRAQRRNERAPQVAPTPTPPIVNRNQQEHERPGLEHNTSYREERYTDTATQTLFDVDSLLVQLDGLSDESCPFGWTIPADAPSSFRWSHGASTARVVYSVTVYAVTETGDTLGRSTREFSVDAIPSPQTLVIEPQDIPVLGCCSNKGVIRMGVSGPSDVASVGRRLPLDVLIDAADCKKSVVRCVVGLEQSVRIRTSRGKEQRHMTRPVSHNTSRTSLNSTVSLSIPGSTVLPSYQGRRMDIQHTLSVTAVVSGCCTNDPHLTTSINIATLDTTTGVSTTSEAAAAAEILPATADTLPIPAMATVIPEATVVTVVDDDEEAVVDDKAIAQPPDMSTQFSPTAPDESLVV